MSFEIGDGETVGFLGLNGAGKTTALRIFACDLRPSAGTIHIGAIDAVKSPHEVRKLVGFLPENPPLYGDMIVTEFLEFSGRIRGMTAAAVKKRMPAVLELTHLKEVDRQVISTLSHGYRQRV
ncbi:MAG TPA: ATP-binding cassette domain-containing protein, partial [Kofleriaceae bacterium]